MNIERRLKNLEQKATVIHGRKNPCPVCHGDGAERKADVLFYEWDAARPDEFMIADRWYSGTPNGNCPECGAAAVMIDQADCR